ncbi:MAG: cytidylate kinase-like family protein [Planctomycetota bacterium]|jgi:cytidylate kinase
MSIITISRGSYSFGKEVAEKVARKLDYECVSRDVLIEASEEFNVPEIKLLHAIRDAPSFFDRFTFEKEKYLAYFRAALLGHFQKGNVVYHGLAGHFLVKDVSHVLKVRILAEMEDRVKAVKEREGMTSEQEALRAVKHIDEARRKWSLHISGIDTNDPSLYDLVIHIKKLSTDDAAEVICHTVGLDRFQPTTESQQAMDDLVLATRVRASLVESYPRVSVTAKVGAVYVGLEGAKPSERTEIQEAVGQIPGVKKTDVDIYPFVTPD